MQSTKTVIAVGDEPVSVAEVKVSARIDEDITELDAQIQTLITSTRLTAEHECEREFLPHTLRLSFSGWPSGVFQVAPITELVGVEALGGEGWVRVDGFELWRTIDGKAGVIRAAPESELPVLPEQEGERVRVTVKVGCPENVRAYIIAMVAYQLTATPGSPKSEPPTYLAGLLDRERNWA